MDNKIYLGRRRVVAPIIGGNAHGNKLLQYKLFCKSSLKLPEHIIANEHLLRRSLCHAGKQATIKQKEFKGREIFVEFQWR